MWPRGGLSGPVFAPARAPEKVFLVVRNCHFQAAGVAIRQQFLVPPGRPTGISSPEEPPMPFKRLGNLSSVPTGHVAQRLALVRRRFSHINSLSLPPSHNSVCVAMSFAFIL